MRIFFLNFYRAMRKFSKISSLCQIYYRHLSSLAQKDVVSLPAKIIEVLPIKPKPKKCQRPSFFIRSLKFSNKILIVGSIYYYTGTRGAWGTPDESQHFVTTIYDGIKKIMPYYITAFFFKDDK